MTTSERTWLKVNSTDNIPLREGRCVEIAGRQVAIFHTGQGFIAVENRCPHRGGPLADGIVNGATVVCPLHAWKFDLLSGVSTNHPEASSGLVTFATRVDDGIVCVELPQRRESHEITTIDCEQRDRPIRWVHRRPLSSTRPGHLGSGRSSLNADSTGTENSQGTGYVSQEF
jgi:nitrite reductase (NADH) small subunit